jgi:hypothetical protein
LNHIIIYPSLRIVEFTIHNVSMWKENF